MRPEPSVTPGREERMARYEVEARRGPIAEQCRRLSYHAAARAWLERHGDDALARGASLIATTSALVLAATTAASDGEFETKLTALRAYVGGRVEPHRAHVAALAEAALAAKNALRMSTGWPPHDRRIGGWMDAVPILQLGELGAVPPDDLHLYADAATSRIVDVALDRGIETVRDLVDLPKISVRSEGAYASLQRLALAVCAEPAGSRPEFTDSARTCVILWLTLRRRRPVAAAVVRARLLHERSRWRTEVASVGRLRTP